MQRAIDRTTRGIESVHALRHFALRLPGLEAQLHVDAPDDEDLAVELHFTDGLGSQASPRGWDLARLQRAPVGSDQSTRGRGDDVVERRGVRLEGARGGAVMLRHRPMRAEHHRLLLGRQPGVPDRTLHPLETHHRTVSYLGHWNLLCEVTGELPAPSAERHRWRPESARSSVAR